MFKPLYSKGIKMMYFKRPFYVAVPETPTLSPFLKTRILDFQTQKFFRGGV